MNKKLLKAIVVTTAALAMQANAGFIDITGGYNVLTFGDFTFNSEQVEGKVAAQGNVELTNFAINWGDKNKPTSGLKAVVSGGDVTLTGGEVYGSVYAANNARLNSTIYGDVWAKNIAHDGSEIRGTMYFTESAEIKFGTKKPVDDIPVIVDFEQKKIDAINYSTQLAGHGSKVSVGIDKVLRFDDIGVEDVVFFTVDAKDLSGASSLYFEDLNKKYVINVVGDGGEIVLDHINQKNYGTPDDFNFSNLLFNFTNASKLKIKSFYGNILAADIDLEGNGGQVWGSVVAQSFSGTSQFHSITTIDFELPPPPPSSDVPESSTTTMLVAGAIFVLFLSRKNAFARK